MSRAQVTFDSKEFDNMQSNLTGQEMKRVIRRTLRDSANILKKETERLFCSGVNIQRNKMSYRKGGRKITVRKQLVKISSDRQEKLAVKVHIMSNFKAKFFEKGTGRRKTKGRITGVVSWGRREIFTRTGKVSKSYLWGDRKIVKYQGANRGANKAGYYFRKAQDAKKHDIFGDMDQRLGTEIVKLANKKK